MLNWIAVEKKSLALNILIQVQILTQLRKFIK